MFGMSLRRTRWNLSIFRQTKCVSISHRFLFSLYPFFPSFFASSFLLNDLMTRERLLYALPLTKTGSPDNAKTVSLSFLFIRPLYAPGLHISSFPQPLFFRDGRPSFCHSSRSSSGTIARKTPSFLK